MQLHPVAPTAANVAALLRGAALAGGLHPVELLDLADVIEGDARRSHTEIALWLDCSRDTVRRVRGRYGRTGDPDAPTLRYVAGGAVAGDPYRTGRAELVALPDQLQEDLLSTPVENPPRSEGEGGSALPPPHARVGEAFASPIHEDGVTPGAGVPPAAEPDAGEEGSEDPRGPDRAAGARGKEHAPHAAGGEADRRQQQGLEGTGRPPARGRGSTAPRVSPASAPFRGGAPDHTEALAQARMLLREARAAGVLRSPRAYATAGQVAAGLAVLVRREGWEWAVRTVRLSILRLLRQREHEMGRGERATFPGRAVLFFRSPRATAASDWYAEGIDQGWGAPGWIDWPGWEEVPGCYPVHDPQLLSPTPGGEAERAVLRVRYRRRARRGLDLARLAEEERVYAARVLVQTQGEGLGIEALRRVLDPAGHAPTADYLAPYGPDYVGTVRLWRAMAAGGSDWALAQLLAADREAAREEPSRRAQPEPSRRAPRDASRFVADWARRWPRSRARPPRA